MPRYLEPVAKLTPEEPEADNRAGDDHQSLVVGGPLLLAGLELPELVKP
jgi:hypothetical protein